MTKDQRREAMPWSTEVVDDMRHNFGEVTFIRAAENGHEVIWNEQNDITGTAVTPILEPKK